MGTNVFPMRAEKLPRLRALLSADEWAHTQAFPSVLRLLLNYSLTDALRAALPRKDALRGLRCRRLLDNESIELDGAQLWSHLNYHLIHLMDALPVARWAERRAGLQQFVHLRALLVDAGELVVRAGIELAADGDLSARAILAGDGGAMRQTRRRWAAFAAERSAKIGHSLEFELLWLVE